MKWYQKAAIGTAGTVGAGLVAWKSMFPWLEYDLKLMKIGKRLTAARDRAMTMLLIDRFEAHVANTPKKTFLIYQDNSYSYEFVDQMACRVANLAKDRGLKENDCVALMAQNEPSFIWTFLGMQKIGVAVSFINFHLRMHPLVHCVLAVEPKWLIVGSGESLLEAVVEVRDDLGKISIFVQDLGAKPAPVGMFSFDSLLRETFPAAICPQARASITMQDPCCYIYTSGTTGNPKPVTINQSRACLFSTCLQCFDLSSSDILYTALPLFHSAGGGIGLCGSIFSGCTMVLRKKFSATHFWSDCRRHNVTVIQYIGELFRYLLAQPPSKLDSQHSVRAAFGNGLRRDIWIDVEKRYKIPELVEFYGATEGLTMLVNASNRPGAIGRMSPFLNRLDPDPKALVKFDYASATPIRDSNGRCIPVAIGEPGLFMTRVPEMLIQNGTIKVYRSSEEANEKKLVRNAFSEGDLYFNYGDVFVLDKDYFLYFQDRIGDTFRWKGENVSTTELANVISTLPWIHDANVYGVSVPGHDGRAGMVALTLAEGCQLGKKELKELYEHVCEELPTYARPLFVRLLDEGPVTGTFKQRKVELVKEGYDPEVVKDPLFFIDHNNSTYSTFRTLDLPKFIQSKL